jgi:hypothetical protein
MSSAAGILGWQAREAATVGRQSIQVKGLAERPVKSDRAVLEIVTEGSGATMPLAIDALRRQQPAVDGFFSQSGFAASSVTWSQISFDEVHRISDSGVWTPEIIAYKARRSAEVESNDVAKVKTASEQVVELTRQGTAATLGRVEYLVSNLEELKMSLIGGATQNARQRAEEFARNGGVEVGPLKSASQGAFSILPATGGSDGADAYGGVYDKGTIDKVVRVVVTIEYSVR